jgi:hypothetical protein
MPAEIRIYFEGDRRLKPGFDSFLSVLEKRATEKRCRFHKIASGSGETACRDFGNALQTHPEAWNILLRDAEQPLDAKRSATLCRERGWDQSHADSIFWMVEMMEAWLHADKEALKRFYGSSFNESALKKNPKVEEISKKDLEDGLRAATKNSAKGGYYENKAKHGASLLESIDPELVRKAAPNCQKLFDAVLTELT